SQSATSQKVVTIRRLEALRYSRLETCATRAGAAQRFRAGASASALLAPLKQPFTERTFPRSAGFPTCRIADFQSAGRAHPQDLRNWSRFAGWKHCDTAGWKPALREQGLTLAGRLISSWLARNRAAI